MSMAKTEQSLVTETGIDDDGFLLYPEMWTHSVARSLARDEVPDGLTKDHWKVINCLRQFYLEHGTLPQLRMLRRLTGLKLEYVYKLFPSGLARGACKIAGIPRVTIAPNFLYP